MYAVVLSNEMFGNSVRVETTENVEDLITSLNAHYPTPLKVMRTEKISSAEKFNSAVRILLSTVSSFVVSDDRLNALLDLVSIGSMSIDDVENDEADIESDEVVTPRGKRHKTVVPTMYEAGLKLGDVVEFRHPGYKGNPVYATVNGPKTLLWNNKEWSVSGLALEFLHTLCGKTWRVVNGYAFFYYNGVNVGDMRLALINENDESIYYSADIFQDIYDDNKDLGFSVPTRSYIQIENVKGLGINIGIKIRKESFVVFVYKTPRVKDITIDKINDLCKSIIGDCDDSSENHRGNMYVAKNGLAQDEAIKAVRRLYDAVVNDALS